MRTCVGGYCDLGVSLTVSHFVSLCIRRTIETTDSNMAETRFKIRTIYIDTALIYCLEFAWFFNSHPTQIARIAYLFVIRSNNISWNYYWSHVFNLLIWSKKTGIFGGFFSWTILIWTSFVRSFFFAKSIKVLVIYIVFNYEWYGEKNVFFFLSQVVFCFCYSFYSRSFPVHGFCTH